MGNYLERFLIKIKDPLQWIIISLTITIILVAFAGMYKFNYLANQEGYDVDGNKIKINK